MEKYLDLIGNIGLPLFGFGLIALFLAVISKSKSKIKKVLIMLASIMALIGLASMIIRFFYA